MLTKEIAMQTYVRLTENTSILRFFSEIHYVRLFFGITKNLCIFAPPKIRHFFKKYCGVEQLVARWAHIRLRRT